MSTKLKAGDEMPSLAVQNIHGRRVTVPEASKRWTHLQFRRFAGCPSCNVHLQTFVRRHDELASRSVHEVVVFHSSNEALLPFQGSFPFDVIGDPDKRLYRQFGVETSIRAILDPAAWPSLIRGSMLANRPSSAAENGPLGLPADFLVGADARIAHVHYGVHAADQWSIEDVLAFATV